jgi:hypothetical protein
MGLSTVHNILVCELELFIIIFIWNLNQGHGTLFGTSFFSGAIIGLECITDTTISILALFLSPALTPLIQGTPNILYTNFFFFFYSLLNGMFG